MGRGWWCIGRQDWVNGIHFLKLNSLHVCCVFFSVSSWEQHWCYTKVPYRISAMPDSQPIMNFFHRSVEHADVPVCLPLWRCWMVSWAGERTHCSNASVLAIFNDWPTSRTEVSKQCCCHRWYCSPVESTMVTIRLIWVVMEACGLEFLWWTFYNKDWMQLVNFFQVTYCCSTLDNSGHCSVLLADLVYIFVWLRLWCSTRVSWPWYFISSTMFTATAKRNQQACSFCNITLKPNL